MNNHSLFDLAEVDALIKEKVGRLDGHHLKESACEDQDQEESNEKSRECAWDNPVGDDKGGNSIGFDLVAACLIES